MQMLDYRYFTCQTTDYNLLLKLNLRQDQNDISSSIPCGKNTYEEYEYEYEWLANNFFAVIKI